MIGPVLLVVVMVLIWATVASRHQHQAERSLSSRSRSLLRPALPRPVDDLDGQLDRWASDGLLTADQASAIRAAEAERLAAAGVIVHHLGDHDQRHHAMTTIPGGHGVVLGSGGGDRSCRRGPH